MGKNVSINLGKADAVLSENEQVKGEVFKPTEHIKVYILEVKDTPKGPRILVSRKMCIRDRASCHMFLCCLNRLA